MNKTARIIVLIVIFSLLAGSYLLRQTKESNKALGPKSQSGKPEVSVVDKPQVALIFDDLGASLKDIKEVYLLKIPLTIAVLPGLKFSKNIAYIGYRCGHDVLIHLPLEPENINNCGHTRKYTLIGSYLPRHKIERLFDKYLNYIRIAVGVNTHMGSAATQDKQLMALLCKHLKDSDLVFIDSRTSEESVAYKVAKEQGLVCGYNQLFLDNDPEPKKIKQQLHEMVKKARVKGKLIVIAHPRPNTFKVLNQVLPQIKNRVDFITITDYFKNSS